MDRAERLRKERERIRIASQKTRQKRREEEQTLREENEKMKRERSTLMTTFQELEKTLDRLQAQLSDKDESTTENELLSRELEQYREFGSACLLMWAQSAELKPEKTVEEDLQKRIFEQVARSGGEMSDLQAERILAESLEDDIRWRALKFDTRIPQLSSCVSARYRVNQDGGCEWQFSFCVPNQRDKARLFAEKYRSLWDDPRTLMSIFSRSSRWFGQITDSAIEQLASYRTTKLQRITINSQHSWAFVLTARDAVDVARSTLVPTSMLHLPFLARDHLVQDPDLKSTSSTLTQTSVAETNRVGIVECWTGTRASIMLDSASSAKNDCVKGKFLESFRVWNEEIFSSDVKIAGPGVRGVCIMSASQDFARETFGEEGFRTLFNFNEDKVAPLYQNFVDFIAGSMGLDQIPIPHGFS